MGTLPREDSMDKYTKIYATKGDLDGVGEAMLECVNDPDSVVVSVYLNYDLADPTARDSLTVEQRVHTPSDACANHVPATSCVRTD